MGYKEEEGEGGKIPHHFDLAAFFWSCCCLDKVSTRRREEGKVWVARIHRGIPVTLLVLSTAYRLWCWGLWNLLPVSVMSAADSAVEGRAALDFNKTVLQDPQLQDLNLWSSQPFPVFAIHSLALPLKVEIEVRQAVRWETSIEFGTDIDCVSQTSNTVPSSLH